MAERSLFALNDLLQGTNSLFLYFKWHVGDDFHKTISNFRKKNFNLIYFIYFFNVITAAP